MPDMDEGIKSVNIIQVIQVQYQRGSGAGPQDPWRMVTEYWSLNGGLLFVHDPLPPLRVTSDLLSRQVSLTPERIAELAQEQA